MSEPSVNDLKIWWYPQIGGPRFEMRVQDVAEARIALNTLAKYDLFQRDSKIRSGFSNAGGLDVYDTDPDDDELPIEKRRKCWLTWYNDDGEDIDNIIAQYII